MCHLKAIQGGINARLNGWKRICIIASAAVAATLVLVAPGYQHAADRTGSATGCGWRPTPDG
jgi:hypothetical protein